MTSPAERPSTIHSCGLATGTSGGATRHHLKVLPRGVSGRCGKEGSGESCFSS
ncbi:uncharacterized protein PGTG_11882 [Puccinia graminis f. sp. tritici CRL 75-36-700-3]|uniref:Uncharacterized protein n=1 Tax=Puccinia graminis f. sp. tritici (strain CRL 75-36-700-3 / race SCCL) TaxID=418459 RepID=E3KMK1_PUCGT|nr:uncharacterized protein PGTG_11882 [Puccinia graminis f. sp. tritici CRL 75-36-700-3]EFP85526.2 hypothetical protein PGTG_11882 [Puccinia graminis f. sp. tritici CRL 75-36-700-3]